MKKGTVAKYKIGLAVIMLFVIVLLIFVVVQASATKQDNNTYNQANNIADTLNNYIDTNLVIPASLSEAGVNNVPSTISYQALSSSSYKFCVDYKSTSSGFDTSGVETELITAADRNANIASNGNDYYANNSYLYIDSTHHKGENCQTITPFQSDDNF
jgi:hypothetical protein